MEAALVVAALLGTAIIVLSIPVLLVVRMERTTALRTTVRVRWLYGLIDVGTSGAGRPLGRRVPRDIHARKPKADGGRMNPRMALSVLRTPGLTRRLLRLLHDLRRQVALQDFHLRIAFGLEDPADTGQLYGALVPLLLAASTAGVNVECRPDFLSEQFQGVCGVTVRVRPVAVLAVVVAFLCSVPFLRSVWRAWRSTR